MKKIIYHISTLLLISIILLQTADTAPKWKANKEKNGFTNYIAPLEGSKYNQYMASGVINVKPEVLIAVFRDTTSFPKWVHKCLKSDLLKNFGNDKLKVLYVHHAMFPVTNRFSVVQSKFIKNWKKGVATLYIDSIEKGEYELEDHIEMDFHAKFIFEVIGREKLKVTFSVKFDPGGDLATSLVDLDTKLLPIKSLIDLNKIVKKKKFISMSKKVKEIKDIERYCKKNNI